MKVFGKHILFFSLVSFFIVGLSSCKKEEDTTKQYLNGYFRFEQLPHYIDVDQTLHIVPFGITHPDKKALGLSWYCTNITSKTDTLYYAKPTGTQRGPLPVDGNGRYPGVALDFNFHDYGKDTLGTFTFTFSVYPIDSDVYYSSSSTVTVVTVDEERSIPEIQVHGTPELLDSDGNPYNTEVINGLEWITRNWSDSSAGGMPFDMSESMSYILGRFYTHDEAVDACPAGYRLPTSDEWDALAQQYDNIGALLVNAHFNTELIWEFWPEVKITGESGLDLLPAGYANKKDQRFVGYGKYAAFWTSDKDDEGRAVYKYVYEKENSLKTGYADASMAMPVRCVKK